MQDSLKTALKNGTLALPAEFEAQKGQIAEVLRKVSGRLDIKNADERRQVPLRKGSDGKAIYLSDEFKALWDRIKHQTTYRVQFDNAKLVTDCIAALQKAPAIAKARLQWRKADIAIGKAGVAATEKAGAATVVLDETDIELPDLLTDLQDRTQLTRRTIVSVLTGSGRLDDFKRNPQQFIELGPFGLNWLRPYALFGLEGLDQPQLVFGTGTGKDIRLRHRLAQGLVVQGLHLGPGEGTAVANTHAGANGLGGEAMIAGDHLDPDAGGLAVSHGTDGLFAGGVHDAR